jgi:hypothetical protein
MDWTAATIHMPTIRRNFEISEEEFRQQQIKKKRFATRQPALRSGLSFQLIWTAVI